MKKKTNLLLLPLVILLACMLGFGFYYVQQKAKQEDLSKVPGVTALPLFIISRVIRSKDICPPYF